MAHQALNSPGQSLKTRLLAALVLGPIAFGAMFAGGWWFAVLIAFVGSLMAFEWQQLTSRDDDERMMMPLLVIATAGAILALAAGEPIWAGSLLGLAMIAMAVTTLIARNTAGLWAILGLVWLAVPCLCVIWLRGYEPHGGLLVVWLFAAVWGCDTGAYFAGKSIGGPRLAPRISPKKTWSGLFGGMMAAALAGLVAATIGEFQNILWFTLASAGLGAISQIGDLAESALKRHFNVKDSGRIIPGHGGVLDRVDGLLLAAPVVAAWIFMQSWFFTQAVGPAASP